MISNELGIVAIGRNEGKRLINCLNSIRAEAKVPTVYVDSGSTDGSSEAAARLGVTVVNLDMTRPFTAARARNEGFAALVKLQSEYRASFNLSTAIANSSPVGLRLHWSFLRNGAMSPLSAGGGASGIRKLRFTIGSAMSNGTRRLERPAACGGDAMIRAEALQAARGYRNELIAGEEPELCLRLRELGWKIWRLDAEMTRHDAAMTRFANGGGGPSAADMPMRRSHSCTKIRNCAFTRKRQNAPLSGVVLLPLVICIGTSRASRGRCSAFSSILRRYAELPCAKAAIASTAWTLRVIS